MSCVDDTAANRSAGVMQPDDGNNNNGAHTSDTQATGQGSKAHVGGAAYTIVDAAPVHMDSVDSRNGKYAIAPTVDVSFAHERASPSVRATTTTTATTSGAAVPPLVLHSVDNADAPPASTSREHGAQQQQQSREQNYYSSARSHEHSRSCASSSTREQQRAQRAEERTDIRNEPTATPHSSIYSLLQHVIVHHDRPLENLPVLTPPELKIIGRCVTFTSETNVGGEAKTLHYEGLVGTINKDTVMLINVYRFTEEDFAQYKETQQKPADVNKYTRGISTATAPSSQQQQHGSTYSNNAAAAGGVASMGTGDATLSSGGGLALEREENEALSMVALTRHTETLPHARGRLKNCPATTGPIPYMTFMRNHIQNVKFGNDPQSSFYSLFRDPSRRFFDMQCLRMFVRRYIVHTSQGNNPRNVPMRAFVVCRCNCPDLDEDLLESVLFEELVHLVKVDRDMKRAQRQNAAQRRQRLLEARAPRGIFRHTGYMYYTYVPVYTLFVAAVHFVFVVALLVSYLLMLHRLQEILMEYVMQRMVYALLCVCTSFVTSLLSSWHSVRMTLPLRRRRYIIVGRGVMSLVSLACALLCLGMHATIMHSHQLFDFLLPRDGSSSLCRYYSRHDCYGLDAVCLSNRDVLCKCFTPYKLTCRDSMEHELQPVVITVVAISAMLALSMLTDLWLLAYFLYIGKKTQLVS